MARPLRIEFEGGAYHVTSRGNRREDIYMDDTDRGTWFTLLGETCKERHVKGTIGFVMPTVS